MGCVVGDVVVFFFFKQKTAYEIYQCDWSSDVCSSDLVYTFRFSQEDGMQIWVNGLLVPVGEDQVQHIEVCRDLAASFNHSFGEVFVLPKAKITESSARVPGTDGEKMSKSYGNTLEVFADPRAQRKKIMRIKTDSRPVEEPKEPAGDVLLSLYELVATPDQTAAMAAVYRRGGFGYGEVKKALADAAEQFFAGARGRREEMAARPDQIRQILGDGASRARRRAAAVLKRAQEACGVRW